MKTTVIFVLMIIVGLLVHQGIKTLEPGLVLFTVEHVENVHTEFQQESIATQYHFPNAENAEKNKALILQKIFFPIVGVATLISVFMVIGMLCLVQKTMEE